MTAGQIQGKWFLVQNNGIQNSQLKFELAGFDCSNEHALLVSQTSTLE